MIVFKKFNKKILGSSYALTIGSAWSSRAIIIIAQLLSIPIFYKNLGLENFAVFSVVTGLTAWYGLLDFGMGPSLQNYISEYRAQGRNPDILLAKTLPLIIIFLILIVFLICFFGDWFHYWLLSRLPNSLTTINFDICLILYCWYFMLNISSCVFFAYQKGFWGYFYQTTAYTLLLLIMFLIHFFKISLSLDEALYCWIIPLFLCSLIAFFHAFKIKHIGKNLSFNDNFYSLMLRRAFKFWLGSVSQNGVLAMDYLVIAKLLLAVDIVTYNIVNKIWVGVFFAYSAVLSALWPILAERYAKNTQEDFKIAEIALKKTILTGFLYILISMFVIIIFRHAIISLFQVQQNITMPLSLLFCFGAYGLIRVWSDTYSTVLRSQNKISVFFIQTPIQAVVTIFLMIILSKYALIGIMMALIISFLILPVWILPFVHYKMIGNKYVR